MGTQCLTATGELFINIYWVELLSANSSFPLTKKLLRIVTRPLNVFKWKMVWTSLVWVSSEKAITPCQALFWELYVFYSVMITAPWGRVAVGGLPVSTLTLLYTADSYFKHLKFSAFSALAAEHIHPTCRTLVLRRSETAPSQWQRGLGGSKPASLPLRWGVWCALCTLLMQKSRGCSQTAASHCLPVHFSTPSRVSRSTFQGNSFLSNPVLELLEAPKLTALGNVTVPILEMKLRLWEAGCWNMDRK